MDAPEDELDIKLQKMSGDLIADFDKSLGPFLRRKDGVVRSRVRSRETERLVSGLLNPFQELPQLLDPHLQKWLTPLVDAFLEYLLKRDTKARHQNGATTDLLMPLPAAISKIIYTLCKIRGEKVVVRFLNNETKYLEVLLSALEQAERAEERWTWEQRYVVLLWLSHLMLVPFDLASISSLSSPGPSSTLEEEEDVGYRDATKRQTNISGFTWPATQVPGITRRIIPLAIKYIASPGKERDAAKAVLVRISMRRDMQALSVLDALIAWAVGALGVEAQTPYYYIGVLGFLSGILTSSADTSDMDVYLDRIFKAVHGAAEKSSDGGPLSSALSRKSVIKVIRAIAVLLLRNPERASQDDTSTEIIETTISFLLEQLGDNDTPVRFAASKALSIITLRLEPDMATQVVEAVIESLSKNVLWHKDPSNPAAPRKRDLSAVDPLEWHGLMLTLAHLLYRRSPPAENLPDIIHALIMGLSFERRSPSGGSIGTNVRDAACFGVWALARRYSTKELLAVPTPERLYKKDSRSIIQILATELILAGCLDAAGNIRRGSSAALQELIGRHPDTVEEGIKVVQVVDYHGVALRGRAVQDIALSVTKLAGLYGEAVLEALLSWRGVGDADAASRRAAGRAFGGISAELARAAEGGGSIARLRRSVELVLESIRGLAMRQVEERHGLLLSFAAVLDSVPEMMVVGMESGAGLEGFVKVVMDALVWILDDCQSKTYRKPALIAEAASTLVVAAFPILQAATIGFDDADKQLLPGAVLVKDDKDAISKRVKAIKTIPEQVQQIASLIKTNLADWLTRTEEEVLPVASDAALVMLVFSGQQQRESTLKEWAEKVRHRPSSGVRIKNTTGYFFAVTKPYQVVATLDSEARNEAQGLVSKALNERWQNDNDVDTHVAILKGLTGTGTLRNGVDMFMDLVIDGLDDYTTNARGDVGSLARLQAIRATKWVWEEFRNTPDRWKKVVGSRLFLRILRLAAEKLDRVRVEAQAALAVVLKPAQGAKLRKDTFSSVGYFSFLLDLLPKAEEWLDEHVAAEVTADRGLWMEELLSGLVSSADTGNEDLVIATRQALTEFCERSADNSLAVCCALVRNLKSRQGQDRVLVPTLEVVAFLFHVGVFANCPTGSIDYKGLCLQVQKACYKTGNVRKTEACVRVYGGIIAAPWGKSGGDEGIKEAKRRLGALMMHPWPRVKSLVVDEIWGWSVVNGGDMVGQQIMGIDWAKAEKGRIKLMVKSIGFE
ncbi:tubulin folding cofactor D C terminal-domain-containing protein [Rhypophila decipiens]|uniref:Tubulin folding cofactor D C terminal-domain-containing protein n=1 Tax=Rhypophila decipiens TaxID=261697 RepID=A0AAN7B8W9_9PEZI|nr:tubulin folding cofactor D C terminal-domain-containing protein [Rhypophila decipiens]